MPDPTGTRLLAGGERWSAVVDRQFALPEEHNSIAAPVLDTISLGLHSCGLRLRVGDPPKCRVIPLSSQMSSAACRSYSYSLKRTISMVLRRRDNVQAGQEDQSSGVCCRRPLEHLTICRWLYESMMVTMSDGVLTPVPKSSSPE